jgi:hypothetical protein
MKEWEHHVMRTKTESYCGVKLTPFDWLFQNAEHAVAAIERGMRLQPCPECQKIIDCERAK